MSEVLYSAGEPGASSCSDEATGANEATRSVVVSQAVLDNVERAWQLTDAALTLLPNDTDADASLAVLQSLPDLLRDTSDPANSGGASPVMADSPERDEAAQSEAASAALANGRGHLFNEIANHALSLRSLVGSALQSTDTHEQGALLDSAYSLAALIGYLADAAADAMRCSLVVGGADDWLLSPVARKALQTLRDRGAA